MEENKTEESKLDPVEYSAKVFTETLPTFKKMVASTSGKKSLVRLINELIEFPLAPRQPRLLNEHERTLFWLFQELTQHKSVVLQNLMKSLENKEERIKNNGTNEQEGTKEGLASDRNVTQE